MPARIKIEFDHTPEGVAEAMSVLVTLAESYGISNTADSPPVGDGEQKPKRTRKKAESTSAVPAESAQPAQPPADPLAMLGLGAGAGTLPPAAAPAAVPVAAPTPTPAPAAVDQKSVIAAFVKLGQTPAPKGGPDAIRKVLGLFSAATVTAIKPEQYAQAVAAVQQALAA